jgi:bifunctional non-homologous end joining protein LigD
MKLTVQGRDITLNNPDKPLWPDIGLTKSGYLKALAGLAPYLLPHTAGKSLTCLRYPHGVGDEFFYQKRPPNGMPEWVKTMLEDGDEFVDLDSLPTLIWLGTMAALEFHTPFGDEAGTLTALVFDMDPSEGQMFEDVRECALIVHETLEQLGVASYAKTSGASGLQVYIPTRRMTFAEGRQINLFFGQYFASKHPEKMTIERIVKNRGRKLYFDYLQMGPGKSIVSVYSPRAVPCGAVSMPVTWEELARGAMPCDFNLTNAVQRLEQTGDLFSPMLAEGRAVPALEEILKRDNVLRSLVPT